MIRVELVKLVLRPRSWVSILLLCGLPVVVAVFVAVTHIAPPPGQGPALLSEVLSSGTLYPAAALAIVLPIFLPVAVAVVAGDAIAGEASAGTLRYLLARPVGRTRLLVRAADTALLNAQLVAGGVRVTEISAERRSLEDVVLAVTSSGSDRVDRPVSRGRPAGPGPGEDSDVLEQGNVTGGEQA